MKDEEEIMNWVKTVYPETTFCKKKCICGNSADLPYCDNTHKIINKRKIEEESTK
jgi:CDGSH-type Zn-finger protein